jgi:tRNA(fMet)-specific endonuclease VapC
LLRDNGCLTVQLRNLRDGVLLRHRHPQRDDQARPAATPHPPAGHRAPQEQFTTSITVGELIYGARRVGREDLSRRVEQVIRRAQTVLAFDTTAARTFGFLKATLEQRGTPLAEPDLRIASIALSRGLILVTRNVRHFQHVAELTVENWIDET